LLKNALNISYQLGLETLAEKAISSLALLLDYVAPISFSRPRAGALIAAISECADKFH